MFSKDSNRTDKSILGGSFSPPSTYRIVAQSVLQVSITFIISGTLELNPENIFFVLYSLKARSLAYRSVLCVPTASGIRISEC